MNSGFKILATDVPLLFQAIYTVRDGADSCTLKLGGQEFRITRESTPNSGYIIIEPKQ